jgi:hypothetical protein
MCTYFAGICGGIWCEEAEGRTIWVGERSIIEREGGRDGGGEGGWMHGWILVCGIDFWTGKKT